ncbi:MAG: ABC transporter substrate-binding protein [Clostridiales bacterium]|nr:ABC transporter substrate-binding protein [Clostridiales bacterium]
MKRSKFMSLLVAAALLAGLLAACGGAPGNTAGSSTTAGAGSTASGAADSDTASNADSSAADGAAGQADAQPATQAQQESGDAPAGDDSDNSGDDSGDIGDSGGEKEPANLVVAWWGSQSRNEKFQGALDKYMELNPHVAIESQTSGFSDHMVAMQAAAASNAMPDIVMLQGAYYGPYVSGGLLTDLNAYAGAGLDLSEIADSVLASTTVDGKLYGICAGTNSPAVLYNKTLLDEHGIAVPDYMGMDGFAELSAKIYAATGYKTYISNPGQMVEYILRGYGHVLYGQDALGAESYEQLLPYYALLERGRAEGWLIDISVVIGRDSTEEQPMLYSDAPENSSWCSFFNSNQADAMQGVAPEGMEIGLATCPTDTPDKSGYLREAMSWTVPTQAGNTGEAIALLNWIVNSYEANEIIMAEPGVPANATAAAAIAPGLSDIQKKIFAYINDVVTPRCAPSNPPAGAGGSEAAALIEELHEKVYYGELTAEAAAKELFDRGNAIMREAAERTAS